MKKLLIKHSEYDIKNTIYLTQEEYDDLNINNEINFNIVIGKKIKVQIQKNWKNFNQKKQVDALENI